jgi:ketosteroid isomerase-like protein
MAKTLSPNVETIRKLYEVFRRGDPQEIAALFTSQVQWDIMPGFPYGGTYVGLEAVFNNFYGPLMQDFEDWRTVPEEILDAGDDVIALGHYHSRAKATGRDMTAGFAHVWSVREGKVTRLRQYADTVQLARALGSERSGTP